MTFEPGATFRALDIKSIVIYHDVDFQLFTTEISGYLAPDLGSPFACRHPEGVVVKPFLGSGNHLEEIPVFLVLNEFRPAEPLAHPLLTVHRIGIYRQVGAVFLLPGEAMNDS